MPLKLYFFFIPLYMYTLGLSAQSSTGEQVRLVHTFYALEDSAIEQPHSTKFGINTGWSIYRDIMFPGTKINGSLNTNHNFHPGSTVLNCRITDGDKYNNLFFTSTLAKQWVEQDWYFKAANQFVYSMDFYVDNYIDCNRPNFSELEGLEFTFQQAMPPVSFLWGLQWSKSNVWSYWDDTKIDDKARGWVKIRGLNACMRYKQWNHIFIYGHRNGKKLFYDSLKLNNVSFVLNKKVAKASLPTNWAENYLQVGFQINGNKAIRKDHRHGLDPVSVYLNNIHLQVREEEL